MHVMSNRAGRVLLGLVLSAALAACGPKTGVKGEKGEAGARVVLGKLKSDPKTLASLKPSDADLKELFEESAVEPMKAHVAKMYDEVKSVDLEDDPAVHCYATEEIKAWNDVQYLPGGYKQLGDKLKSDVVVCSFKSGGKSWDGLMWAGGRWFFVAKPFRALEKRG